MATRVNPNILPNLLYSIQQSEQNQAIATEELATGRSVNALSDNPAAAADVVGTHNQSSQDDQYLQNISTLQTRFQSADSTLSNAVEVLTRAVSLGTEGANGTLSASDRQSVAAEVQGLQTQLLSLANTTYQGTYLFAGTAVTTLPFTLDPVTGAATYNGNSNVNSVHLTNGTTIPGNIPGNQLFQNAAGDAFGALQNLNNALLSNSNIGAAVNQVNAALGQLDATRVTYGNGLNQINLSENFLSQDQVNLSTQENALTGIDLAKAASDLAQSQIATQATLSATGRILSLPTLLDFLK